MLQQVLPAMLVGMKRWYDFTIKCWIHAHPFGAATLVALIGEINVWKSLMQEAYVLGGVETMVIGIIQSRTY